MRNLSVEKLPITTHNNIPVITTEMLASLYGTDPKLVRQNYQRNAERFIDGKHCFKLLGDDLRAFKNETSQRGLVNIAPKVSHLFLWTERGAARHAKMLETEQAWEVFEKLEDCYFSRLPLIAQPKPEVLADLVGTATTLTVRDGRRGKSQTTSKAAQRIADECVPMIMRSMRNQYHYGNDNVGPEEVLPALISESRSIQLYDLLRELAENEHNVSGCYRELEAMRYFIIEFNKRMNAIASHAAFINQQTKIS
ncbi:ORF6N domain-containing protein [Yersinia massiliensis]|uniref:ORF6N domain-containing protein n=1 Tax=Yersinia massiliensis TaxID=419257 RepID=UPI00119D201A|nr:ORF6N domain-containing protein [Yersinia massiliensis]